MAQVKHGDRVRLTSKPSMDDEFSDHHVTVEGVVQRVYENYACPGVLESLQLRGYPRGRFYLSSWTYEVLEVAPVEYEDGLYIAEVRKDSPLSNTRVYRRSGGKWTHNGGPLDVWYSKRIMDGTTPLVKLGVVE